MEQWHQKDLGDGMQAHAPSSEIQSAFLSMQLANGGNAKGVAVFSRYDLKANKVTVYFSPKATLLAEAFSALPCAAPSRGNGIGLLVGDASAWELLGD